MENLQSGKFFLSRGDDIDINMEGTQSEGANQVESLQGDPLIYKACDLERQFSHEGNPSITARDLDCQSQQTGLEGQSE